MEVGPKDIENNSVMLVRRDNLEKIVASMDELTNTIHSLLDDVHNGLYQKALAMREAKTVDATDFDTFQEGVSKGFVRAMWCGCRECEDEIKAKTSATTRCMPFDQEHGALGDVCVHCGKPAKHVMYFAKAY